MRRLLGIVLMLAVSVVAVAEVTTERPMDGLYESIVDSGFVNGTSAPLTPWVRIGVDSSNRLILLFFDTDEDGSLEDEVVARYRGTFYRDGVKFMDGTAEAYFFFVVDLSVYRLMMFSGDDVYGFDFYLVERW
jgi:hypothetical protein